MIVQTVAASWILQLKLKRNKIIKKVSKRTRVRMGVKIVVTTGGILRLLEERCVSSQYSTGALIMAARAGNAGQEAG